jgi:hypothetical protein
VTSSIAPFFQFVRRQRAVPDLPAVPRLRPPTLAAGRIIIKLYFGVTDEEADYARVSDPGKPLQPVLVLKSKGRAYPQGAC